MRLNSHILATVLAVAFSAGASITFARSTAPTVDVSSYGTAGVVAPVGNTFVAGGEGCGCGGVGCDGSCGGGCGDASSCGGGCGSF